MERRDRRWLAYGVFVLSSTLNYLDRQVLATLAPLLLVEFHLTRQDYGFVLSAFSIVYALAAPPAGLFIDRLGLNRGISLAVLAWSLAAMAIGSVHGFTGLAICGAALGLFQAGGIPGVGKAIRLYLHAPERALGHATSQLGLSLGGIIAPPMAAAIAVRFGWRYAFVAAGILGFLWVPLWNWTSRRVPATDTGAGVRAALLGEVLRDVRLWGFIAANAIGMTVYTLWTNWTPLYLTQMHHQTLRQVGWLASIPPFAAPFGGFLGGWFSLRLIRSGMEPLLARRRACLAASIALLLTAAVPQMPTALSATGMIALSFFFASFWSVNLYSMPLDVFDPARAAFGVATLTGAYGAMQFLVSPLIGRTADHWGFGPVCLVIAVMPLLATGLLWLAERK